MTLHSAGRSRAVSSFYFHHIYTAAGNVQPGPRPREEGGRDDGRKVMSKLRLFKEEVEQFMKLKFKFS